jgi:hypothetical protein
MNSLCVLSVLLLTETSSGFVFPAKTNSPNIINTQQISSSSSTTSIYSALKEDETKTALKEDETKTETDVDEDDVEGLPWWWDMVWKLDMMQLGEPGKEMTFGDTANVLRTNIEQIYGGFPSLDGCPLAEGELGDIADGTMFIGLQNYYKKYGSPYKLCFGPKSFLVVSDPVQARHLLRDANKNYDKVRMQGKKTTA